MMLTLTSCLALSQDTLKIEPITHNGQVGLFVDSTSAKIIAHKLEEGSSAVKELEYCDSSLFVSDSMNATLVKLTGNLQRDLDLANDQIKLTEDKVDIVNKKYLLADGERKRARRQRWVWGGVGVVSGIATGIVVGILVK